MALAPPPPLHIAAAPILPPFCFSTWIRVTSILAPDAPNGCPSATAPPFIFTLLASKPSNLLLTKATTENASLSSNASTSAIVHPALSSAIGIALAGAVVKNSGSCAASAKDTTSAIGVSPSSFTLSSLASIIHAAPSFIVLAFAAVTVPSFSKTGRSEGIFSNLTFLYSSSSRMSLLLLLYFYWYYFIFKLTRFPASCRCLI